MRNISFNNKLEVFDDKWLQCNRGNLNLAKLTDEKEWNRTNVWKNAPDIKSMFHGFKHIIEVDWQKILHKNFKRGYWPNDEFTKQFYYPYKDLGDHSFVMTVRGEYTEDENIFDFGDEFGTDATFAMTNNDEDATFIALKYK